MVHPREWTRVLRLEIRALPGPFVHAIRTGTTVLLAKGRTLPSTPAENPPSADDAPYGSESSRLARLVLSSIQPRTQAAMRRDFRPCRLNSFKDVRRLTTLRKPVALRTEMPSMRPPP
jgi:hypothetical protein